MEISYHRSDDSIKRFLRYLLNAHESGMSDIGDIVPYKLYQEYKNFCNTAGLDYFRNRTFQRELGRLGILAEIRWVPEQKKLLRVRTLDVDAVRAALSVWVDNSCTTASMMEIDGSMYRVTIRLEKMKWGNDGDTAINP
jgi:hypothetical protein